ncbi:unnamed protein product [Durusdinium trenchii]|uniref:5'-nucleotidase n=1 Tax=Durusdinium trenchii TaxID=1381693 RepID=A0ABP0KSM0_9DINO
MRCGDLEKLGLHQGEHYDMLVTSEDLDLTVYTRNHTLLVGDSIGFMERAEREGFPAALVCSGQLSQFFDLSPAPNIDVPANGGHFVEPDPCTWQEAFGTRPRPRYGLACFAFSEGFFFRFFAERRALARRRHSQRSGAPGVPEDE